MLVIVSDTSGSPFECTNPVVTGFCPQHSFIGFTCVMFVCCFFTNTNKRKACQPLKGVPVVVFRIFLKEANVAAPASGNLFFRAGNLLTTRSRSKLFPIFPVIAPVDLNAVAGVTFFKVMI